MHAIMYYFRRQLMEMSINDFAYSSLKQVKAQKGEKKKNLQNHIAPLYTVQPSTKLPDQPHMREESRRT